MPLWDVEYFELKVLENRQVQEGLADIPLSAYKRVIFPRKAPSLRQEKDTLILRAWGSLNVQTDYDNPALPSVPPHIS